MFTSYRDGITRALAAERAVLDKVWGLLREAMERSRLLDECVAACRKAVMKEAEEIHSSAAGEAEEILAQARTTAGEILAQARAEATEIIATARQRIPLTVGPPNPALAGGEARRVVQLLLDQARANADGLLSNAWQRLEEAEERKA
jgi:cell division septum initiation protein DivIVA